MKTLTIIYSTSRPNPEASWFTDSLMSQMAPGDKIEVVIVSFHAPYNMYWRIHRPNGVMLDVTTIRPKPTIWQGPHKLVKEEWWAKSNALNSGLCYAKTEWVAFLDDRSVLMPGWLDGIKAAMEGNYVVLGAYQKRHHMQVTNGEITVCGTITGEDHRIGMWKEFPPQMRPAVPCGHSWSFGATIAMPTQWALDVGGFEEELDGMSAEDTCFGAMLENNGHVLRFDATMLMIEDRTGGLSGDVFRREDKGKSPDDKSHAAITRFYGNKHTTNYGRLMDSRAAILAGGPFPILLQEPFDWYDGEPIGFGYPNHDYKP